MEARTEARSQVTSHEPIQPGFGSYRRWTRVIAGRLYSFTAVTMPDGERRYIANRFDGNDSRFDCEWTKSVLSWTIKPTDDTGATRVVFTSQSPSETMHHGDDVHNFLTDLNYGYSDIQSALRAAQTDPKEQWFGVSRDDDEFEHAVRYVRETDCWQVAEVPKTIKEGTRVISTNRTNQPHGVVEKLLYPTSGMFAGHTIVSVTNDDGTWSFEYIEHVEAE